MLDPKVTELADRMTRVQFEKRREQLQRDIEKTQNKMTKDGLGRSGALVQAVYDLCARDIERRAEIVWENISRVLSEAEVKPSETLADELKQEVLEYANAIYAEPYNCFQETVRNVGIGIAQPLTHARDRALAEVNAKIDLYVLSLTRRTKVQNNHMNERRGGISLEPEEKELLIAIVEATRDQKVFESLRLYETREGDFLEHPALPSGRLKTSIPAVRALDRQGLVELRAGSRPQIFSVDLTAPGRDYYQHIKSEIGGHGERDEPVIRQRSKAPEAFESAFNVYSVTGVRGEGGSGRVFAVKDADGREFALKCLFPDRVNTERRKRFKNELDFCRRFRHHNIIQVTDFGLVAWDNQKCPFYVMPLYPTTLRKLMENGVAPHKVLALFSQILDGVEAAHLHGVFHRDIKPENILYDHKDSRIVVADFGIAHFEEDIIATAVETGATARMANLCYSAPEQRVKGATVNRRADIFALGLILNEMFTRSVPQGSGYATIAPIAPQFAYLDLLVEKMIHNKPDARPGTIEEIKKELIGRQNEFVALQELDRKRGAVVPTTTPPEVEEIRLVGVDWEQGRLILRLNRAPEAGWLERFARPTEGYSSLMGAAPHNFQFRGDTATIAASERDVQQIADSFKRFIEMATRGYKQDLKSQAKRMEMEQRATLAREVEEAEARARILKNIKL